MMGSQRSRRALVAVVAVLVSLPLVAASAAPARTRHGERCSSGASSVRAHVVDGRIVSSSPATSGCRPGER
jgi:hypothetical protein